VPELYNVYTYRCKGRRKILFSERVFQDIGSAPGNDIVTCTIGMTLGILKEYQMKKTELKFVGYRLISFYI
jgi:hypothetical protein